MDQPVPLFFTDLHRKCLAAILRMIADYYGERMVSLVVFGSYARREPRFDSDLDSLEAIRKAERIYEIVSQIIR